MNLGFNVKFYVDLSVRVGYASDRGTIYFRSHICIFRCFGPKLLLQNGTYVIVAPFHHFVIRSYGVGALKLQYFSQNLCVFDPILDPN